MFTRSGSAPPAGSVNVLVVLNRPVLDGHEVHVRKWNKNKRNCRRERTGCLSNVIQRLFGAFYCTCVTVAASLICRFTQKEKRKKSKRKKKSRIKIQSNISTVEFFCTTGNQSKLSCDHVSRVLKQALSLVWCGGRIFITVFVWLNSVCGNAELASAENRKQESGQRLTEETLRVIFSLSQEVRLLVVHS